LLDAVFGPESRDIAQALLSEMAEANSLEMRLGVVDRYMEFLRRQEARMDGALLSEDGDIA
jgi:hypothetical protein